MWGLQNTGNCPDLTNAYFHHTCKEMARPPGEVSYEDRGCDLVGKGLPGRCKAQDSVSITAKTKPMNRTTKHQELIVKRELNNMSRGLSESRILTKVLTYVPNSEMRRVQLQIISRGNIISLMLLPGSAFNNAPFIIHSLPHSEYLWFQ